MPEGAGDSFDDGNSVVVTKNKVRGNGKAISINIRSEEDHDLHLYGLSMVVGINGNV